MSRRQDRWVGCHNCSHLSDPICCPVCDDERGYWETPVQAPVKAIDLFEALRLSLLEVVASNPCTTTTPTCDPLTGGASCVGSES